MTPIQFVAVCLRVLAVVWFLHTLNQVGAVFAFFGAEHGLELNQPAVWMVLIAQFAACAFLWFFPVSIASKLLPSYSRPPDRENPPALVEWQTLGVICVGLWALSRAIPSLIYWLTFMNVSLREGTLFSEISPENKAALAMTIAEVLVSLWLLLGSKGLAAVIFKIRTAGVSKS